MATKIDANASHLIDLLSDDIIESMTVEQNSQYLWIFLPPEDYQLLISSSQLMYSVFQKLSLDPQKFTNSFIIYPLPTKVENQDG